MNLKNYLSEELGEIESENNISDEIKPLQISYRNNSDTIQTVSMFEIFNKNSDNIEIIIESGKTNMEFLKKYFYETPHLSNLITISIISGVGNNTQIEKVFYEVERNPMGESFQNTAFVLLDQIKQNQFQSKFIEVEYGFVMDGLTKDLEFELLPKSTIKIVMSFQSKCQRIYGLEELNKKCAEYNKTRKGLVEYLDSIFVENTTSETKVIDLLNPDKLTVYNASDSGLLIGDIFNRIGDGRISKYKTDILANYYSEHTKKHLYFNCMRIAVTKSDNGLNQVSKPIQFNSGNTYCPNVEDLKYQFQSDLVDIYTVGEELSTFNPFRVSILPNTRVVFLFKKVKCDITKYKLNLDDTFVNIVVENNTSDSKKIVNVLNNRENCLDINYMMVKNKSALGYEDDKTFTGMRVLFNNSAQMEKPIIIKGTNIDNLTASTCIWPLVFKNEASFVDRIIVIPFLGYNSSNNMTALSLHDELIFDLSNKGDGVNIVLLKENLNHLDPLKGLNSFIIEIENTTDEEKEIDLVNDVSKFKGFSEGIKTKWGNKTYGDLLISIQKSRKENVEESLRNFLDKISNEYDVDYKKDKISEKIPENIMSKIDSTRRKIEITKEYSELIVQKIFSENSEQSWRSEWYFNSELPYNELKKSRQGSISKNNLKLDLNIRENLKIENPVINIKTSILPKTKIILVCSMSSKTLPHSNDYTCNF